MRRGDFPARRRGLARLGGHGRLWLFQAIVIVLLAVLVARLWDVQVLASEHYSTLARDDFVRDVVLPATRGLILDRTGKVVVDNQASWSVLVDSKQLRSRRNAYLDQM